MALEQGSTATVSSGDDNSGNLVILIGYRGTGKTTVARLLAERLGWSWLDADGVLEARAGKTIRQIFAEEGESGFRQREAALLEALCRYRRHVLATGGGIVLRPENRALLRQAGAVIWLTADADTIWQRLCNDATTAERRPNLTVGGREEVEQLLRLREPLYRECADLTLPTTGRTPAEIADCIMHWLQQRGTTCPSLP